LEVTCISVQNKNSQEIENRSSLWPQSRKRPNHVIQPMKADIFLFLSGKLDKNCLCEQAFCVKKTSSSFYIFPILQSVNSEHAFAVFLPSFRSYRCSGTYWFSFQHATCQTVFVHFVYVIVKEKETAFSVFPIAPRPALHIVTGYPCLSLCSFWFFPRSFLESSSQLLSASHHVMLSCSDGVRRVL